MAIPKVLIKRTATPNAPPPNGSLSAGELCVEMDTPTRLWVGVPTAQNATGRKLLFDSSASAGSGAVISDTAPSSPANGQLWWQSSTGILWMWYTDPNTSQWVEVGG